MIVRLERVEDRPASIEVERAAFGRDEATIAEENFQIAVIDPERVRQMSGTVRWRPAFG